MCEACVEDGTISRWCFDLIADFIELYPDIEYGFAHIVLAGFNIEDKYIDWCLAQERTGCHDDKIAEIFLRCLRHVPEADRIGRPPAAKGGRPAQ